ncbi:coiled-coil domain-containing protein 7 isoform X2 [Erinaceus europaeus]|uniref:Coiled-coil domain-containing protein 7 isoform X2 n=1 Tax=Erinaceus europaeus TaxID=9365 RepID=A0ABM3XI39_ERIEU|nr:coiled-coil domain-containing protein 7 isoform X2 [Erinaceus europaeus]
MKPAKSPLGSNVRLTNAPETSQRKRPPKSREKLATKPARDKTEPMVLRSPPAGESIVRYALPIPSSKTKELIAEDELIRKITKHLKVVVSDLEEAYGSTVQNGDKLGVKRESEGLSHSIGDDLNSFLLCCSQFATQLDEAVKEEHHILESLFKWFQLQVNQMEEISKDQSYPEADMPVPDKTVTTSIAQIVRQVQKLEELKNRLMKGSRRSTKVAAKPKETEKPVEEAPTFENMKQKIEDFINTHLVPQDADASVMESRPTYSMTSQLNSVLKLFERQSDMLERAMKDQDLLEAKYKQMENDFQVLAEEKLVLENELQKLKDTETAAKAKPIPDHTKKTGKAEKKRDRGKAEEPEEKKFLSKESKTKEDLLQMQKLAGSLENENRVLQEQLKQALQEAERAKIQLDYFLKERKDLLEAKNRPAETNASKKIAETQDSRKKSLEKEVKLTATDSGGQKTNDPPRIPQSQQDESEFSKTSNKVLAEEDPPRTAPSESQRKSPAAELPREDSPGSLPVETSLQEAKSPGGSSPPVLLETPGADFLQSEKEKQTYEEVDEYEVPGEKLTEEYPDSMSKAQMHGKKQRTSKKERLTSHHKGLAESLASEHEELASKTQVKAKKHKASKGEKVTAHEKGPDGSPESEVKDSTSKSSLKAKRHKSVREEWPSTHYEVPDKSHVLEQKTSMSKSEIQENKQTSHKGKKFGNATPDKHLTAKHHDLMSKAPVHLRRRRASKAGRHRPLDDELYEDIDFSQDSASRTQVQLMSEQSSIEETFSMERLDETSDEHLFYEEASSVSENPSEIMTAQQLEEAVSASVLPQGKVSLSRSQSLAGEPEGVHMETTAMTKIEIAENDLPPEDTVSVSERPSQIVTQRATSVEEKQETSAGAPSDRAKVSTLKDRTTFEKDETVRKVESSVEEKQETSAGAPSDRAKVSTSKDRTTFEKDETVRKVESSGVYNLNILYMEEKQETSAGAPSDRAKVSTSKDRTTFEKDETVRKVESSGVYNLNILYMEEKQETSAGAPSDRAKVSTSKDRTTFEKDETVRKVESSVLERGEILDETASPGDKILMSRRSSRFKTHESAREVGYGASNLEEVLVLSESQNEIEKQMPVQMKAQSAQKPEEVGDRGVPASREKVALPESQSPAEVLGAIQMDALSMEEWGEVPSGKTSPEDQVLISNNSSKFKAVRNVVDHHAQKLEDVIDEVLLQKKQGAVSESEPHTKETRAAHTETRDVPKELPSEHLDAEGKLEISPSLKDLIFQFGLDKVVETDIELLADAVGKVKLLDRKHLQLGGHLGTQLENLPGVLDVEMRRVRSKTQAESLLDDYTDYFADFTGRGPVKEDATSQSRKYSETDKIHFPEVPGRGSLKGDIRDQSKNLSGLGGEHAVEAAGRSTKGQVTAAASGLHELQVSAFPDMTRKGSVKEDVREMLKRQQEADTEHSREKTGIEKRTGEAKISFADQLGVSSSQEKQILKRKKDSFSKYLTPNYFTAKGVNISPFENEDSLFENKYRARRKPPNFTTKLANLPSPDKKDGPSPKNKNTPTSPDLPSSHVTASKNSAKVVNISPFKDQEFAYELVTVGETELPRALTRKVRTSLSKGIRLPSLSKKGKSDNDSSSPNYEPVNVLPSTVSAAKPAPHTALHTETRKPQLIHAFDDN